ncbi:hypothetical protein F4774DRAFT_252486 [Daldinia eschscholtzii]|nr:hypothetical protein F4774DRAFT_252486 [Daldinia eschscholtzii]
MILTGLLIAHLQLPLFSLIHSLLYFISHHPPFIWYFPPATFRLLFFENSFSLELRLKVAHLSRIIFPVRIFSLTFHPGAAFVCYYFDL